MKVDDELREAVRKIVREEMEAQRRATQEPEHYDGEPCNLPILLVCAKEAKGLRFEYWEKRPWKKGEWIAKSDWIIQVVDNGINPTWILRAIPIIEVGKEYQWDGIGMHCSIEPQIVTVKVNDKSDWPFGIWCTNGTGYWTTAEHLSPIEEPKCPYKAGDYLWVEVDEEFGRGRYAGICKALEIVDTKIKYRMLNGSIDVLPFENFRPLTDADWTGEIGGVKVQAYENADGEVLGLVYPNSRQLYYNKEEIKIIRTICYQFNIPIMPFELHKGDKRQPK